MAGTTNSMKPATVLYPENAVAAAPSAGQSSGEPPAAEEAYESASRTTLWLIGGGFAMMFLASILMWLRFGPSMFVDLVTAIQSCL